MADNNKKDDSILMMTWVTQNLSLICELDKKSDDDQLSISQFIREWEINQGDVSQLFRIRNPALFVCSLYGLLVIPKENFWDDIPNTDLTTIDTAIWGDLVSTIKTWNYSNRTGVQEDQTLRNYIKHLRNALAHTNYKYDYTDNDSSPKSLVITLEDKDYNRNSFIAELPIKAILLLGTALCKFLALNHLDPNDTEEDN